MAAAKQVTFLNEDKEECTLEFVPRTRKRVVCLQWSCGDTFYFTPKTIKQVIDFMLLEKAQFGEFLGLEIKELGKSSDGGPDPGTSRCFSVIKDKGTKAKPSMWVEDYSISLDFKTFLKAWQELNA